MQAWRKTPAGKAYLESQIRYKADPLYKQRQKEYAKRYWSEHTDARSKRSMRWYFSSKGERYRVKNRLARMSIHKNRMDTDPNYRLSVCLRKRLNSALKRREKSGSAVVLLGCSTEQAVNYIQSKFQDGMTWQNHGRWHIDHIRPLASFDLTKQDQLSKACHYSNLQPLWARDNLQKHSRVLSGA